jgi:hypothetical protein
VARSVLRVADQRAERFPDVCVLTGEPTAHAARLTATTWSGPRWMLGIPAFVTILGALPGRERAAVALPVSPRVWRMWQRRNAIGIAAAVVGALWMVTGAVLGSAVMLVLGAIITVLAVVYRTRAVVNYWLTCRLNPAAGTILVEPTHPRFDEAAKRLFIASL